MATVVTTTTETANGVTTTVTETVSTAPKHAGEAAPHNTGPAAVDVDIICVGAGMSGIYMVHKAVTDGFSIKCFEAGDEVGGTWSWNRYPGAKVDVESRQYSYTWADEVQKTWTWKHRYGRQPEIREYLDTVANHYGVKKHMQFNTKVVAANFIENGSYWIVSTNDGASYTSRYFVMATGCLSKNNLPKFPGMESFKGRTFTTYDFPKGGVDFTGRRVAVIGTGSTGVQVIPEVARQAKKLTVFQRTPVYAASAGDKPVDVKYDPEVEKWKKQGQRETGFGMHINAGTTPFAERDPKEFQAELETRWAAGGFELLGIAPDIVLDPKANETVAEFMRNKIREIVKDPKVAEDLCPTYACGCKRLCISDEYYQTYNRANVELVAMKGQSIETINVDGIRALDRDFEFDDIIFATGFDAMTGAVMSVPIRGKNGATIKEKWSDGPETYLGLMVSDFPNMFTVTGPQSPSVFSNMVAAIEVHIEYIIDLMKWTRSNGKSVVEATREAEEGWVALNDTIGDMTIWGPACAGANSWYRGANIEGKSTKHLMPFPGGIIMYNEKLAEVKAKNYEGITAS